MKKVALLFESSLNFEWGKGHGESILCAISRFDDVVSFAFCECYLPSEIAYLNYLHAWAGKEKGRKELLIGISKRTHRLSAYLHHGSCANSIRLTVNFFESGQKRRFATLITDFNHQGGVETTEVTLIQ